MATPTFNGGIDYFGLEDLTSDALKVKSSNENFTDELAQGENGKGDVVAQDRYNEQATPSADYSCVGEVTLSDLKLGTVNTVSGFPRPIMFTGINFQTQSKSEVTCSCTGMAVEPGAETKRTYTLPAITFTPRHRAQDILNILDIKVGNTAATETQAEITQASYNFTVEGTLASPKGVTLGSDCHGGKCEASFTIGCWVSNVTVALTSAAASAGWSLSKPTATDPENGYHEITCTATLPIIGEDVEDEADAGGGASA